MLVSSLCNDSPQVTQICARGFKMLAFMDVQWLRGNFARGLSLSLQYIVLYKGAHSPFLHLLQHTRSLVGLYNCIPSAERFLSYPDDFTVDITRPITHKFA